MNQQNGQKELMKQWNDMAVKKRRMNDEILTKEQNIIDEIMKGMIEKDEEIVRQKKEILALKMKMAKMEALLKSQNLSISWSAAGLPSELLNELFASLPLENGFGLLAKMPNGLLSRIVRKMINGIKEAMKKNKLNEADCGPKLTISEGGLVAKHSGPHGYNCVRTILPIPNFTLNAINKPTIVFYFEMEILNKIGFGPCIGFCDQKFPLEGKWLGQENKNSIGVWRKDGIWIDGSQTKIGNDSGYFNTGDFVGLGIIHCSNSKIECFATWNSQLFGKAELLSKFSTMQLFPTIDLWHAGDSVRVNFAKEEWQFKEFGRVLE